MSEKERIRNEEAQVGPREPTADEGGTCTNISDPVRRGLCRICGMPVLGAAPFCQEHEPPVP